MLTSSPSVLVANCCARLYTCSSNLVRGLSGRTTPAIGLAIFIYSPLNITVEIWDWFKHEGLKEDVGKLDSDVGEVRVVGLTHLNCRGCDGLIFLRLLDAESTFLGPPTLYFISVNLPLGLYS